MVVQTISTRLFFWTTELSCHYSTDIRKAHCVFSNVSKWVREIYDFFVSLHFHWWLFNFNIWNHALYFYRIVPDDFITIIIKYSGCTTFKWQRSFWLASNGHFIIQSAATTDTSSSFHRKEQFSGFLNGSGFW